MIHLVYIFILVRMIPNWAWESNVAYTFPSVVILLYSLYEQQYQYTVI